jgi:squalene synthase HpnC
MADGRSSVAGGSWTPETAYKYCQELARSHYENFTVASPLLPRDKRPHVYAIYAFCRFVDDLGDEDHPPPVEAALEWASPRQRRRVRQAEPAAAERLALLDRWQRELESCYVGEPSHPVMVALKNTIWTFDIPQEPFLKLIEANRMDQRVQRHPTFDHLLDYCGHSANPVGHLFLYLFGYRDAQRRLLADYTCTALQLTNFWQDLARDYAKGRIYLPLEDMERFGYTEGELARGVVNQAFRKLMAFEVQRTRELFQEGKPLVKMVAGQARLDVDLFTRGGTAVLDAIQRRGYDVFSSRPTLSRRRKGALMVSSWLAAKLSRGAGP